MKNFVILKTHKHPNAMLELPETRHLSDQAGSLLAGKTIAGVQPASSAHKFAFYNGDPADYPALLLGKKILGARGHGMFVDLALEDECFISISDGTNMRLLSAIEPAPSKHQLLIAFDDGSQLVFTVAMYGGIWAFRGSIDNIYHQGSLRSTSPLLDGFDEPYFEKILAGTKKDLPLKGLLATEQRIPGLGNGVLQDILFNARLHPKRKTSTLSSDERSGLFRSLKQTLQQMSLQGGRDTEKDLFGRPGGYKTILSRNTLQLPCPRCGGSITKEAYMGGAVYYCKNCQT